MYVNVLKMKFISRLAVELTVMNGLISLNPYATSRNVILYFLIKIIS